MRIFTEKNRYDSPRIHQPDKKYGLACVRRNHPANCATKPLFCGLIGSEVCYAIILNEQIPLSISVNFIQTILYAGIFLVYFFILHKIFRA